MQSTNDYTVIGGGPVGLTMAMLLQKTGYQTTVYEKRPDPRKILSHGRSINLALSDRGFKSLSLLGLEEKIKSESAIPMIGRMIHDLQGNTQLQPYSTDGKTIYSVSRGLLNNILLDEAEQRNIPLFFDHACESYDTTQHSISLRHAGETIHMPNVGTILGCDGAFSTLRKALKNIDGFEHTESKLDYGYKELTIPQTEDGLWQLEKNALHIWPRKSFMLIALPNTDGSFTCTLFLSLTGSNSFEHLSDISQANRFFAAHFADAVALMPHFDSEFSSNPVSHLFMETCSPWHISDQLLLLGDAAHAIVPFYGQGLNAGLEDCSLLFETIQSFPNKKQAFQLFGSRKRDTDAIGELALQNFIEMRDLVTDEHFLLKRKLEGRLKALFLDNWKTLYELVTFSHVPYSVAQQRGRDNDELLETILQNKTLTEHLLLNKVSEQDMFTLLNLVKA